MQKTFEMQLAGKNFKVETGRVAELASGSCLVYFGETVVLCAATASEKPRKGIDFFPLSVDYEEKLYSVGKIPGGFIKREGRPSENSVLTSRLIDRPIRPLFPDDYRNDVAVVATVLSVDQDASPEVAAMIGSSIALAISDIPFLKPTSALNIGLVDGEIIICPDSKQRAESDLLLTVASIRDKIMMIEAGANEVNEEIMFKAIMEGHKENLRVLEFIEQIVSEIGKPKHSYEQQILPEELYNKVTSFVTSEKMEEAVFSKEKQERDEKISLLKEETINEFASDFEGKDLEQFETQIGEIFYQFEKATVRKMILKDKKRPDGRQVDELRKLTSEIDILPRTHGSAIFSRGQTQVLTITTLGSMAEAQRLDGIDEALVNKRYMHHYNFPSYSVGETRPNRGPGRREIGHGALAEKALAPVLPTEEEFPYSIRTVSEVLSSNGSTSQASVCASTLSLMAAGVPIKAPVAGISVGLVTGETDDDFVLIDDIQGLEDFFGDMDFKVAGTEKGITAIQLDMKVHGLTANIVEQSLAKTKIARTYILNESMLKAIDKPREEISKYAPKIKLVEIAPEKMAEVIGARGKTIKFIMESSGVSKIDTGDDGKIFISDQDLSKVERAAELIRSIVNPPEVGKIYKGKVTRILNFGAFVEFAPEKEGLVHISQLAKERVAKVEDIVNVGDIIDVKVLEIDDQGRVNLSRKATL